MKLRPIAAAALLTAACGGGQGAKTPAGTDADRAAAVAAAARREAGPPMAVKGFIVASIGENTLGPFMARRADSGSGLAAWITAAEGSGRRVIGVPLSASGEPRGPQRTLATTGVDATMLVVKPLRGGAPGFVVAWTALTDRGEALWAIATGDDAAPRGKPVELARTAEDVVWVDVVPTDAGAVCLWAEETGEGGANVIAAALDTDGKVRHPPSRVASGVTAWNALEVPGGAAVTTVGPPPADAQAPDGPRAAASAGTSPSGAPKPSVERGGAAPKKASGGALTFRKLDAEARPVGAPVSIAPRGSVSGDVEVARDARRTLFAWTDTTGAEPFVAAAALDDAGQVEGPRRVASGLGGATLVRLASGPDGAGVLWESPPRRGDARHVHLAKLGAPGPSLTGPRASLEAVGAATPELAATRSGFAVLAPMRDCDAAVAGGARVQGGTAASPAGASGCAEAPVLPSLVRTDRDGAIVQRETFGFGGDPASIAWGLSCGGRGFEDACFALAASGSGMARVRTAAIAARTNLAKPPAPAGGAAGEAVAAATKDGPRVVDVAAVASGEAVVDLAAVDAGGATMLAMLTAKPEPPSKKGASSSGADDAPPRTATLSLTTRLVDPRGVATAPNVITTRALAVGGVAIAPAEKPEDGAAIAWVARENGDPEVHVTRLDRKGKRMNDVQLTTTKGDASDVAIVWAGGGWIVAWVDGRDGNGEVYATKVQTDLQRIAREERITRAPGDASDLVALGEGDLVWLAWADPRESPKDGMADIYTTAVKMHDAKRALDETRVLATAAHSRTPQLASLPPDGPAGVMVAWIEQAPMGMETPAASGYGAMSATLGAKNEIVRAPARVVLGGEGAATSIALEPGPSGSSAGIRAVVARATPDAIALDAAALPSRAPATPLISLDGPPSLDVALVLLGGTLFFNDSGPEPSDRRARRAAIDWTTGHR